MQKFLAEEHYPRFDEENDLHQVVPDKRWLISMSDIRVAAHEGDLVLDIRGESFLDISNHMFGQLARLIGAKNDVEFLSSLPATLAAQVFNNKLKKLEGEFECALLVVGKMCVGFQTK